MNLLPQKPFSQRASKFGVNLGSGVVDFSEVVHATLLRCVA